MKLKLEGIKVYVRASNEPMGFVVTHNIEFCILLAVYPNKFRLIMAAMR